MTSQTSAETADRVETRTFLGHPWGLAYLFGTELWERFAFYGVLAFIVLYMVNTLFTPGHVEHILFYTQIKGAFESVLGPLSAQAFASQVYGIYVGLVYLAPFFGGLLADRVLGQRKAVAIGAVLLAIGYFMMSVESLFFLAFPVILAGNGCFKPNISTQVGNLYPQGDRRRDAAFSMFYVGINVGGFFGPGLVGPLATDVAWSYGFLAAAVGMVIALVIYLYGQKALPPDALSKARAAKTVHAPLTREEGRAIWAFVALVTIVIFFWAVWYQQFNTINLWPDENTDRAVGLFGYSWSIPTTLFQTLNGAFIILLTPPITAFWKRQALRGREPSTPMKMAIGCILQGLSFVLMVGAALQADGGGKASSWWLIGFYIVYTAGELYLSPVGLSLVTKIAPARMVSMLMGVWFLANFAGGIAAGWLGALWETMPKSTFFLLVAAISGGAGLVMALFSRKLQPMIQH